MVAQPKVWAYGHLLADIVGLNPFGIMGVCLL